MTISLEVRACHSKDDSLGGDVALLLMSYSVLARQVDGHRLVSETLTYSAALRVPAPIALTLKAAYHWAACVSDLGSAAWSCSPLSLQVSSTLQASWGTLTNAVRFKAQPCASDVGLSRIAPMHCLFCCLRISTSAKCQHHKSLRGGLTQTERHSCVVTCRQLLWKETPLPCRPAGACVYSHI